jgi:hypothetical protein
VILTLESHRFLNHTYNIVALAFTNDRIAKTEREEGVAVSVTSQVVCQGHQQTIDYHQLQQRSGSSIDVTHFTVDKCRCANHSMHNQVQGPYAHIDRSFDCDLHRIIVHPINDMT